LAPAPSPPSGFFGATYSFFAGTDPEAEMQVPVLGVFGGVDAFPGDVEAFERALDSASVSREIVVYPGAPHSFIDRKARGVRQRFC
jgi:dienelactone hydrolase